MPVRPANKKTGEQELGNASNETNLKSHRNSLGVPGRLRRHRSRPQHRAGRAIKPEAVALIFMMTLPITLGATVLVIGITWLWERRRTS